MKLVDSVSLVEIVFPYDLLWSDEFSWNAVVTNTSWGVGGSLIVQKNTKLAGRPITLKSPSEDQGWFPRSVVASLYSWADIAAKTMVFYLEQPTDSRSFNVIFDGDQPIKARPVKGWAEFADDEYYVIDEIKLITT